MNTTTANSVTQCPECGTAFHVGAEQLEIAGGRVRCGSCLEVFNAKEHFVVEQTQLFDGSQESTIDAGSNTSTEKNLASEPEKPHIQASEPDEDLDIYLEEPIEEKDDGPVILGGYTPDSSKSIPRSAIRETAQADNRSQADTHQPHKPVTRPSELDEQEDVIPPSLDTDQIVELDDPLAPEEREALLGEVLAELDLMDEPEPLEELDALPVMASGDGLFNWGSNATHAEKNDDSAKVDDDLDTELSDGLEELESLKDLTTNTDDSTDDDVELSEEEAQLQALDQELESIVGSVLETDAKALARDEIQAKIKRGSESAAKTKLKTEPDHADQDDEQDPLSPDFFIDQNTNAHPGKAIGGKVVSGIKNSSPIWNIAALLLLVSTSIGVIFLQPVHLTHTAWFRSLSDMVCTPLPCSSVYPTNVDALRVSGSIEPKAEINGVLTAKLEILNRADYEQPFPDISLVFRDVRGQISSSRSLKPTDYLRGQARSMQRMPINRPVYAEVDFLDPGERSVSYELKALP